jgi:hypothetical protein
MFSFDMHVETVVLLSHKKQDGHINVKVEFGEGEGKVPLDNIVKRAESYKPKERVTYKMIKEYIEAKYGFKVHTAYIAEVKRDLREDKGLLHNRYDMSAFARHFPESAIKGNYCTEYGFRVDTEKHAFLLRCNPTKGDYNFYCYCYVKEWLDKHIQKAEQGV